ncbi:Shedu protein SduA C-terminal domain-containing protein [Vibrio crassostreae]|uniref:Shedu immune nuclease family protein n=1 Tax=Vibrio crassostreae TaxID=246167 RepID=UPI001B30152C|nr:Shedu immune nuclease family protein [Vibrio crassostreae]CAK2845209.1 Shedu protein SduA C-terminal domain-containing protein [Vibrio crassostreae]
MELDNKEINSSVVTRKVRPRITSIQRKLLIKEGGSKCMMPDCRQELAISDKAFIGQVAMIEAFAPGGPRFNSESTTEDILSQENLLLLCPNCHNIIDRQPEIYTVDWLKGVKKKHLDKLKSVVSRSDQTNFKLDEYTELSLKEAIEIWEKNKDNSSEEFWQDLLTKCPSVLGQVFPNSSFQLGAKSYVGGKNLKNRHGNIVDFIYASKHTDNVVLVEIKTPTKELLGSKYRANSYAISSELSGSLIQVLNYKEQLLKEYYKLKGDETSFNAFSPKCLVVIGNIDNEMTNLSKIKSLELFRGCLSGVQVITYDELFEKAKSVLELVEP